MTERKEPLPPFPQRETKKGKQKKNRKKLNAYGEIKFDWKNTNSTGRNTPFNPHPHDEKKIEKSCHAHVHTQLFQMVPPFSTSSGKGVKFAYTEEREEKAMQSSAHANQLSNPSFPLPVPSKNPIEFFSNIPSFFAGSKTPPVSPEE